MQGGFLQMAQRWNLEAAGKIGKEIIMEEFGACDLARVFQPPVKPFQWVGGDSID